MLAKTDAGNLRQCSAHPFETCVISLLFSRVRRARTPTKGMKRNRHCAFGGGRPQDIPIAMIEWLHRRGNGKIRAAQSELRRPAQLLCGKLRIMIWNAGKTDESRGFVFTEIRDPIIVCLKDERDQRLVSQKLAYTQNAIENFSIYTVQLLIFDPQAGGRGRNMPLAASSKIPVPNILSMCCATPSAGLSRPENPSPATAARVTPSDCHTRRPSICTTLGACDLKFCGGVCCK